MSIRFLFKRIFFLIFFVFLIISISCKKSNNQNTPDASQYLPVAQDYDLVENYFNDIFNQVYFSVALSENNFFKMKGSTSSLTDTCPVINILPSDTITWPKTFTIDFGSSCTDKNNKTRKGKIFATITGKFKDSSTVISIVFDQYFINGYKIEGKKTITNKGRINGVLTFNIKIDSAKITKPDGSIIQWKTNRMRQWIAGENTTYASNGLSGLLDDIFLVSDSSSFASATITPSANNFLYNNNYHNLNLTNQNLFIKINSELNVSTGCEWIRGGNISITIPNNPLIITLDYGNNVCDNVANYYFNGYTIPFKLQ